MFRFLILGLLRNGSRLHGYALIKQYRERSGAETSTGNFYRELQRLVSDGLVRSAADPREADARRTPYKITHQGVTAFDAWFTAQNAATGSVSEDDISARALFIPDVDPAAVRTLLDRLKDNVWLWRSRLERDWQRMLARGVDARQRDTFAVLPLLYSRRLQYVAADLEFIEAMKSEYERSVAEHQSTTMAEMRPANAPGKATAYGRHHAAGGGSLPQREVERRDRACARRRTDAATGR